MTIVVHVPPELAEALVADGLGELVPPPAVLGGGTLLSVGDATTLALILLNTSADVIAVTGIEPPLAGFVARLREWVGDRRAHGVESEYSVLAIGPRGQFKLELDHSPDTEALAAVLEDLYAPESPEEGAEGGESDSSS